MNVSLALEEKALKNLIMGHLYPTNLNLYVLVVREKIKALELGWY